MIKCKSIYDKPLPDDGERIFVDRLWPEGITTKTAAIDEWLQEVAPSYELWRHGYDPQNWEPYRQQYLEELAVREKQSCLDELRAKSGRGVVTLLYGVSDPHKNNAVVIKEYLENRATDRK